MYLPVVGLEIHVQVKTKSKMFCRCSTDYFGKDPNIHTCPVCFGLPGAIPVPNKLAFEKCIKLALALNCNINKETKFDRKNYFYPDIPKGYQISQYDQPVGSEGYVEIEVAGDSRRIRLQRVHIEEDTAKSLHTSLNSPSKNGEIPNDETLVDFNKSGMPLIEIVTYPDFESVEEVILFAKRLRQVVRYLDVSDAEMQKGQMRFELNISVKPDTMPAGQLPDYKVEVKNIGSISVLEKVLNFETKRQIELLEKGEKIMNQTRGLKGMTGETLFQRSKESSDDYRYFPEPDIPPIQITEDQLSVISSQIPELPHERKYRYMQLGLEGEQADIFVEDREKGDFLDIFLKAVEFSGENVNELFTGNIKDQNQQESLISYVSNYLEYVKSLSENERSKFIKEGAKWIIGDISFQLEKRNMGIRYSAISPWGLLGIVEFLIDRKINGTQAKALIEEAFTVQDNISDWLTWDENKDSTKDYNQIIKERGLIQITDSSEVEKYAKEVVDSNPKLVADLSRNPNVIKALVGQVMKLSKGKVNPKVAEEELRKILGI